MLAGLTASYTTRPSAIVLNDPARSVRRAARSSRRASGSRPPSPPTPPRGRAGRGWPAPRPGSAARSPTRGRGRPTFARAGSRAQAPREHELGVERRERGLEPGDAERRLLEGRLLLVPCVGRVVGGDAGDRAGAEPSSSARRSASVRSGGFIFTLGSSVRTASSVRPRWCGVTSAVTATPAAWRHDRCDRRRRDVHHMHRSSSYAASARSRSIITVSAIAGQPETELRGHRALVHLAAAGERGLLVQGERPAATAL